MNNQTFRGKIPLICVTCGMAALLLACSPKPKIAGELNRNQDPTMQLWQVYDHCRRTTNIEERKGQAFLLHHSVILRSEDRRTRQARRSVDIATLAASCDLLTGSAMVEAGEVRQASTLYRLVLLYADAPGLTSLKKRARSALNEIQTSLKRSD